MLVLSRRPTDRIQIGDNITITIVRIGPNTVTVGITAPRDVAIVRSELIQKTEPSTKPSVKPNQKE